MSTRFMSRCVLALTTWTLLMCTLPAHAQGQEVKIRKNLADRIPQLPKIEEVSRTPMNGLFELRMEDNEIYYTDSEGNFLIQGSLIDTKSRRNLTEERENQLGAIDFSQLPLKDAITIVKGNGKRKLAVFEDPNCGYCKRFERDLAKIDNVTVYTFLFPVLGANSVAKSKVIWCAKDPAAAWSSTIRDEEVTGNSNCDTSAIDRNMKFGRRYKITGTPTLFAADGSRVPGAINTAQIEKLLNETTR